MPPKSRSWLSNFVVDVLLFLQEVEEYDGTPLYNVGHALFILQLSIRMYSYVFVCCSYVLYLIWGNPVKGLCFFSLFVLPSSFFGLGPWVQPPVQ